MYLYVGYHHCLGPSKKAKLLTEEEYEIDQIKNFLLGLCLVITWTIYIYYSLYLLTQIAAIGFIHQGTIANQADSFQTYLVESIWPFILPSLYPLSVGLSLFLSQLLYLYFIFLFAISLSMWFIASILENQIMEIISFIILLFSMFILLFAMSPPFGFGYYYICRFYAES